MIQGLGIAAIAVGLIAYSQKSAIADEVTVTLQSDAFTKWDPMINKYSAMRNVPWRWLKAILWVESDLGRDPTVQAGMANPGGSDGWSEDGLSRGIMQMTVNTANRRRVRPGTTAADLDNPEICMDCAAKYLAELGNYYFSWDREGCIRAYNGGPGWRSAPAQAQANDAAYYAKFQDKLSKIIGAQPGNEMEIGKI